MQVHVMPVWCLWLARTHSNPVGSMRAVCVLCACRVRAVCVPCACCVRAVCVLCARRVRAVCAPCAYRYLQRGFHKPWSVLREKAGQVGGGAEWHPEIDEVDYHVHHGASDGATTWGSITFGFRAFYTALLYWDFCKIT